MYFIKWGFCRIIFLSDKSQTLIHEFVTEKQQSRYESILHAQGVNSNSSQVSQHIQVAATSANGLSRFKADTEAEQKSSSQVQTHSLL